jgi:transposase InsO family protein
VNGGAPARVFVDNGSEFSGRLMDLWAYHHGVQIDFSRPGKPTDNSFIESFNGSFRDECLNVHWFESLEEARERGRRSKPGESITMIVGLTRVSKILLQRNLP